MTDITVTNQVAHRWYARPVFFVADVNRAPRFHIDMLGFEKDCIRATGRARSAKSIAENAGHVAYLDRARIITSSSPLGSTS